jgi:hypothetical protein
MRLASEGMTHPMDDEDQLRAILRWQHNPGWEPPRLGEGEAEYLRRLRETSDPAGDDGEDR